MTYRHRWAAVATVAVFASGAAVIASADAPANACDSVSTSAIDTIAELKRYDDCRFDRVEAQLTRIERGLGGSTPSASTTPKPSPTTTSPTTTSPTSATPSPTATTTAPGTAGPVGVTGVWRRTFTDEFNGTGIDRSRWTTLDGWRMNNVTTRDSNVAVSGGNLILTLSSASEGAEVDSAPYDGAGANGYLVPVGGYVEARINFPGDGSALYNWPAFWASGPNWPASGEHDIAEVLGGKLTVNYHGNIDHNLGAPAGYWGGGFHTYGLHRKAGSADVYWDGKLVKSYTTNDNGQGEAILINVGQGQGSRTVTGTASQVKVDYVRAWEK